MNVRWTCPAFRFARRSRTVIRRRAWYWRSSLVIDPPPSENAAPCFRPICRAQCTARKSPSGYRDLLRHLGKFVSSSLSVRPIGADPRDTSPVAGLTMRDKLGLKRQVRRSSFGVSEQAEMLDCLEQFPAPRQSACGGALFRTFRHSRVTSEPIGTLANAFRVSSSAGTKPNDWRCRVSCVMARRSASKRRTQLLRSFRHRHAEADNNAKHPAAAACIARLPAFESEANNFRMSFARPAKRTSAQPRRGPFVAFQRQSNIAFHGGTLPFARPVFAFLQNDVLPFPASLLLAGAQSSVIGRLIQRYRLLLAQMALVFAGICQNCMDHLRCAQTARIRKRLAGDVQTCLH